MPALPGSPIQWTLGLDIGSASIGWAVVDPAGKRVVAAGVRIFDAGADLRAFERGDPGASNNTARRQARLQRRQLRRRAGRQQALFLELIAAGLLPGLTPDNEAIAGRGARRHANLQGLDDSLRAEWAPKLHGAVPAPDQVLPYVLRARALDVPLAPFALGRALYHLAQRRGFKSNRLAASGKAAGKQAEADERSKVKQEIGELRQAMDAAGARTLGEHLSQLDPSAARIRNRWTSREMFQHEFNLIWQAQATHSPALTPELRARIERLLFYQRPIGAGTPGKCELEPGQPRARMASLPAQRFRMLQKVNDLKLILPTGERPLEPQEREALLTALATEGDLKFTEIRKRGLVLAPRGSRFNLEAGGETKIPGNRTAARLRAALGPAWDAMTDADRSAVVDLWLKPENDDDDLRRAARERYGLSEEAASAWVGAEPEDGYAKLSLKALARLLPQLESGIPFKTAEAAEYGTNFSGGAVYEQLRPVIKALPAIANPAVTRALTELRKVVNALAREYGKPHEIRIELARDLKRNAQQRAALSGRMRKQEASRKKALLKIVAETGTPEEAVRPGEIAKALLWESCGQACPYCGGAISFAQLFGDSGEAQIEHILPRNRFPDDSFGNKCIAHRRCNEEKGARTPFEAFAADAERWPEILDRVKAWSDPAKLRAFQCTPEDFDLDNDDSFASRRLNETRYTTSQAARYLGQLYGGRDVAGADGKARRVIFATSGMATATLRRAWGLEAILRQPEDSVNGLNHGKPRHDHRHHAVDAIVVALTSNAAIRDLSLAAAAGVAAGATDRASGNRIQAPWPDFVDSIKPKVLAINVSHRPSRKLQGALHEATNYSRPHAWEGRAYVHVRKPVHALTAAQIMNIVDPKVREAVIAKRAAVGGDTTKLEHDEPRLTTRSGLTVPIRRVRVRAKPADSVRAIGRAERERRVPESASHHVEIFAGRDRRGRETWQPRVVSRFEAARRQAACRCPRGRPCDCIVQRNLPDEPDSAFLFSLMGGDTVEMAENKNGTGARDIFVVRTISESATGVVELDFVRHSLAAKVDDLKKSKEWRRITRTDELRSRRCRKVDVDALGRVRGAGGPQWTESSTSATPSPA